MVALLFVITVLGVVLAGVVLRADPKRWDNRVFSLIMVVDALTAGVRAIDLLRGRAMADPMCVRTSGVASVVVAYLSIEFAYSFPFNRRLPWPQRAVALGSAIASVALLLHPATFAAYRALVSYVYFLPLFVWALFLLRRSYLELANRQDLAGIPFILGAVAFRWAASMTTYLVARRLGPAVFSVALKLEATVAVFIGYVLFTRPLLRYHLFRVRGVVAEVLLYVSFALSTIGVAWIGVDLTLENVTGPMLRPALVAVAMIPALSLAIATWLRPRVAEAILADPRRDRAKNALARVVRGCERGLDVDSVLAMTVEAIAEIVDSPRVRFVRGPAPWPGPEPTGERLGPASSAELLSVPAMFVLKARADGLSEACRAELAAMPEELFVLARRAGELFGAFAVDGGTFDRDTIATVITLSEHLSLRIENQRLLARMLSLQTELEDAGRLASLGAFAAAIAHDIRTPLTSIQMNVQILRGRAKVSADDMEYFDIALHELARLNAHITEILDFAKPVKLDASASRLASIAGEAAIRMRPILAERRVALETSFDDALPPAWVDPERIRQVVMNLLDNAAQASAEGSSIVLSTRSVEDRVALEVSDSGRGIKAEDLPKIFEPFFTTRADGTGLGLAIAHKLVRAHGGEIRVASTPGEGSTFTLILPLAAAA